MLRLWLEAQRDRNDAPLFVVEAQDRNEDDLGNDLDLVRIARGEFDQLWLFAVDVTGALTEADVAAIQRFRSRGGACMLTRDHFDMGSCLVRLPLIGKAHHFHTINPEADVERQSRDDAETTAIDWPNYHSGANGDFQRAQATEPLHPIMRRASGGVIEYLPSHPHEGAVSAPDEAGAQARVVATGISKITGRSFNIAVAFEGGPSGAGRALAEATFHRFADYNWDTASGAPDFVTEPPGQGLSQHPEAMADARHYAANIARWLAGVI